jgi:hypothetical protein
MVRYKLSSDDNIVSVLDYVDENLSKVESSNSDNETWKDSDSKSGTSDAKQKWQASGFMWDLRFSRQ